jgi:aldehyde dehydrogenase (NAD+)
MDADRFYIGGDWVAPSGGSTMPIMDPSMDEQVGTVALGGLPDVDRCGAGSGRWPSRDFGRWSKTDRLALLTPHP